MSRICSRANDARGSTPSTKSGRIFERQRAEGWSELRDLGEFLLTNREMRIELETEELRSALERAALARCGAA